MVFVPIFRTYIILIQIIYERGINMTIKFTKEEFELLKDILGRIGINPIQFGVTNDNLTLQTDSDKLIDFVIHSSGYQKLIKMNSIKLNMISKKINKYLYDLPRGFFIRSHIK